MSEDVDSRIAEIIIGLVRLGQLLPRLEFENLLGAVAVEIETGIELVEERRLTRREIDKIVSFPRPHNA